MIFRYLIIFILTVSCLTPKRYNRIVDKAIKKGWIDTTSKSKIDTLIKVEIDSIEIKRIINETILKDTCFNKEQKFIGFKSNPEKLKKELSKYKCLSKPIFINQKGINFEIFQDSMGMFRIKFDLPAQTIIKKQNELSKFEKYFLNVWFLYLFIGLLLFVIILRK